MKLMMLIANPLCHPASLGGEVGAIVVAPWCCVDRFHERSIVCGRLRLSFESAPRKVYERFLIEIYRYVCMCVLTILQFILVMKIKAIINHTNLITSVGWWTAVSHRVSYSCQTCSTRLRSTFVFLILSEQIKITRIMDNVINISSHMIKQCWAVSKLRLHLSLLIKLRFRLL